MTVFKGYLKVTWKNRAVLFLYIGIFYLITLLIQQSLSRTTQNLFSQSSLNIGIVREGNSALAEALTDSLKKIHTVVFYENDPAVLQEVMYYGDVDYILYLPEDLYASVAGGSEKLAVTKVPGSFEGYYLDRQIETFLNSAKVYHAAGFTEAEAAAALKSMPETVVKTTQGTADSAGGYRYYFNYIAYLFLTAICYGTASVMVSFSREDIRRRLAASCVSSETLLLGKLAATSIAALLIWVLAIASGLILYRGQIPSDILPVLIANSFLCLTVTLAFAHLIGVFVSDRNVLMGIVTTASLAVSFLCGIFVEMDIMAEGVQKAAAFLPWYWYVRLNNFLCERGQVTPAVLTEIRNSFAIQAAFAAVLILAVFAAGKKKNAAV